MVTGRAGRGRPTSLVGAGWATTPPRGIGADLVSVMGASAPTAEKLRGLTPQQAFQDRNGGKQLETSTGINPGISKIRVLPSGTALQTLDAMT